MLNERYNNIKELHPDWSEEQIQVACSLGMEVDKTIEENKDIDPDDPDVVKRIIEGARDWLREALPEIFAQVSSFFDYLLNTFGEWVKKGLSYLLDAAEYLYDKGKIVIDTLKTPLD